jgi:hypothetical protein
MNDHGDALLAIGLVLAFIGGALGSRLLAAYRFMSSAKAGAKAATGGMRALRLSWLMWAVVIFAFAWLWLHRKL